MKNKDNNIINLASARLNLITSERFFLLDLSNHFKNEIKYMGERIGLLNKLILVEEERVKNLIDNSWIAVGIGTTVV